MAFDEEELDPHGECKAEIDRLTAENEQLMEQIAFHQPSIVERDMQLVMAINNRLRAALEEILETHDHSDNDDYNKLALIVHCAAAALANEQDK